MSNRQARREQSRSARQTRPTRSPGGQRQGPKRGGGGGGILSTPFLIGIGVLIVAAFVGVIVYAQVSGGGNSDQQYVTDIQNATKDLPLDLANGNKLGKDDAPLKLTTFVDFQCPFCLKFTATQEPTLINEYVKTGKMQIIVQPYPIFQGDESFRAAQAGECAASFNKFFPYYDKLYLVQAQAGQVSNEKQNVGRFTAANLIKYATDVGMDKDKFTTCLNSGKFDSDIQASNNQAKNFGITATPGFLINGTPIGSGTPATIDDWRNALNKILTTTPTATGSATPATTASPTTATASPTQ
ncbi:MAG TPA: thioredoxin domain-containing protein [Tepidiformaceae bacterium]|nr:thioredoxin domain-containing protein [Tepidiformaceae bacterium]